MRQHHKIEKKRKTLGTVWKILKLNMKSWNSGDLEEANLIILFLGVIYLVNCQQISYIYRFQVLLYTSV